MPPVCEHVLLLRCMYVCILVRVHASGWAASPSDSFLSRALAVFAHAHV